MEIRPIAIFKEPLSHIKNVLDSMLENENDGPAYSITSVDNWDSFIKKYSEDPEFAENIKSINEIETSRKKKAAAKLEQQKKDKLKGNVGKGKSVNKEQTGVVKKSKSSKSQKVEVKEKDKGDRTDA